jgi:hypothetical protein
MSGHIQGRQMNLDTSCKTERLIAELTHTPAASVDTL